MSSPKFTCLKCGLESQVPDDRYGAPVYFKESKSYKGFCVDCCENMTPEHIAQTAFDELGDFSNQIAATFDRLDGLSQTYYNPIEYGKAK